MDCMEINKSVHTRKSFVAIAFTRCELAFKSPNCSVKCVTQFKIGVSTLWCIFLHSDAQIVRHIRYTLWQKAICPSPCITWEVVLRTYTVWYPSVSKIRKSKYKLTGNIYTAQAGHVKSKQIIEWVVNIVSFMKLLYIWNQTLKHNFLWKNEFTRQQSLHGRFRLGRFVWRKKKIQESWTT